MSNERGYFEDRRRFLGVLGADHTPKEGASAGILRLRAHVFKRGGVWDCPLGAAALTRPLYDVSSKGHEDPPHIRLVVLRRLRALVGTL
jgi:hypothetical protein